MFKGRSKKKRLFIIINMIIYICCVIVLIVEASMNGTISGNQSNTIGGGIADIVNTVGGDQSSIIYPEKVTIDTKITSAYVGESFLLDAETYPENASFKSIEYASSDENVATIDANGKISFVGEGEVLITASNTYEPTLKDEMSVVVTKKIIPLESLTLSFTSNKNYTLEDGIYILSTDYSYQLKVEMYPLDANDVDLKFTSSNEDIIKIENRGFQPKSASDDEIITLSVTSGNISSSLQVKVIKIEKEEPTPEVLPDLTTININSKSKILAVNETQSLSSYLTFAPSNAKDKTYSYEITSQLDNNNQETDGVIQISSSGQIKALKYGQATILITSKIDHTITATLTLNVKEIALKSFSISGVSSIEVNKTSKLTLGSYSPSNASVNKASDKSAYQGGWESSDPNIISIDNSGNITANGVGSATLSYTYINYDEDGNQIGNITKSKTITVYAKTDVDDFTYNVVSSSFISSSSDPYYLYTNDSINLKNVITVNNLYFENNIADKTDVAKDLTFEVESLQEINEESQDFSFENNILTIYNPGNYIIRFHLSNGIEKSINLTSINKFKINVAEDYSSIDNTYSLNEDENTNIITSSYQGNKININLNVGIPTTLCFDETSLNNQTYQIVYDDNASNQSIAQYVKLDDSSFSLFGLKEDSISITLIPYLNEQAIDIDELKVTINVNFEYIYVKDFTLNVIDSNEDILPSTIIDEENTIEVIVYNQQTYSIEAIFTPYSNPPTSQLLYSVDETSIKLCQITDNQIKFTSYGDVTLTITEKYSGVSHQIVFHVNNIIALDETNPFTLSQGYASYDEKNNCYRIVNAESGKIIINFTEASTYNKVTYTSSDESILLIGDDGSITPLNKGEVEIYALIDDGNQSITITIKIEVTGKNVIEDLADFFYKVRKGLGHFGAFLVLGIFSSFFYLTAFDKKKWAVSMPINFIQGFAIALITELIQVYVPHRSGLFSDVMIDTSGFAISSITITLVYLIMFLVKYLIAKKKGKQGVIENQEIDSDTQDATNKTNKKKSKNSKKKNKIRKKGKIKISSKQKRKATKIAKRKQRNK